MVNNNYEEEHFTTAFETAWFDHSTCMNCGRLQRADQNDSLEAFPFTVLGICSISEIRFLTVLYVVPRWGRVIQNVRQVDWFLEAVCSLACKEIREPIEEAKGKRMFEESQPTVVNPQGK
jgi:hypothetical protein